MQAVLPQPTQPPRQVLWTNTSSSRNTTTAARKSASPKPCIPVSSFSASRRGSSKPNTCRYPSGRNSQHRWVCRKHKYVSLIPISKACSFFLCFPSARPSIRRLVRVMMCCVHLPTTPTSPLTDPKTHIRFRVVVSSGFAVTAVTAQTSPGWRSS